MRWSPQGRMSDGGHTPHPGACVCRPLYGNSTERNWGAILTHLPQVLSVGVWTRAPPALALCGRSCAVLKSTADLQSGHRTGLITAPKMVFFVGCYRMLPGRVVFTFKTHRPLKPHMVMSHISTAISIKAAWFFFQRYQKKCFFSWKFHHHQQKSSKNPANKNPIPTKTTTPHHRRPLHLPSRSCYKNYGPTVKERPKIGRAWTHLEVCSVPLFFDNSYPP